jgi:putative transposase
MDKKICCFNARVSEKITPNVSDAWPADELYSKIKGNPKYLFALMDDQMRFWIAQQVADTKYTSNIQPLTQNESVEKDQIL